GARADVQRRRPGWSRRSGGGVGDPGAAATESVPRLWLHGVSHQLDCRGQPVRHRGGGVADGRDHRRGRCPADGTSPPRLRGEHPDGLDAVCRAGQEEGAVSVRFVEWVLVAVVHAATLWLYAALAEVV